MRRIMIDVLVKEKQLPPLWRGAKRLTRENVGELDVVARKVREIDPSVDPAEYVRQLSEETGQEMRLVPPRKEAKNA